MWIGLRLRGAQPGFARGCRNFWLIAASVLAWSFAGASEPALAQVLIPTGLASVNAVNLANSTATTQFGASATLTANNATIVNNLNPSTGNNTGLRIQSAGSAIITASGKIDVAGT